jgi:hypothetical protein
VIAISRDGSDVRVEVAGASGRRYELVFMGVESLAAQQAEGMRVYALSEMRENPPVRRFVFANWDEEDDAALEVQATGLRVHTASRLIEEAEGRP